MGTIQLPAEQIVFYVSGSYNDLNHHSLHAWNFPCQYMLYDTLYQNVFNFLCFCMSSGMLSGIQPHKITVPKPHLHARVYRISHTIYSTEDETPVVYLWLHDAWLFLTWCSITALHPSMHTHAHLPTPPTTHIRTHFYGNYPSKDVS